MSIKTSQDVDGLISLQKSKRIATIEKEIRRLHLMPAFSFFCMITYIGFVYFIDGGNSWLLTSIFFAGFIAGTGQAAMRKVDLVSELSELKLSGR
jgi:hypothetical protein